MHDYLQFSQCKTFPDTCLQISGRLSILRRVVSATEPVCGNAIFHCISLHHESDPIPDDPCISSQLHLQSVASDYCTRKFGLVNSNLCGFGRRAVSECHLRAAYC